MISRETNSKIEARHLKANAYLYVRQSTLRQVFENQESTKRQYDLRRHAIALGWPVDQIIVIDSDLGQSGASAVDREGFQRLVTEVSMGRAGIVMGLEVSRLARNSTDWHRLLEICALTNTLILDEDGIYDPAHFNDRLLLGLKGTMSEAELHVLRARLRGGILNKAKRGELEMRLPIGFVYEETSQRAQLDPDRRIQNAIRMLFRTFHRMGSASATVRVFREQKLQFPRRAYRGTHKGEILWGDLEHSRVLWVLHHPRYAGAFCFGRTRQRKYPDGRHLCERLPRDEWAAFLPEAHEGYITWAEFEDNNRRLRENARAMGADRRSGPPREGPALLQGLAICAVCGERMTVRYHASGGRRVPDYVCQRRGIERAEPICQQINGGAIDDAIGKLLVETVTPVTLEVALTVQKELEARVGEAERARRQEVESARYDVELARRRYMKVDPDNRMVADTLEADWNAKLRMLAEAQDRLEHHRQTDHGLDKEQRARILALATNFPRLWNDPRTPDRERKRMARLLIDDVTLLKADDVTLQIRFRGGATRTLAVPLPRPSWMMRRTSPEVVDTVNRLLDDHTDAEIAKLLNDRGMTSGTGKPFHAHIVARIRDEYGLRDRHTRLRARGLLEEHEVARRLHVEPSTIKIWRRAGLLVAHRYNDKGSCLYERPGTDAPVKFQHQHKTRGRLAPSPSTSTRSSRRGAV